MRGLGAAIFVLCGLFVGCGGGGARFSSEDLPNLVLRPDDVPKGFVSLQSARQARGDQFPGAQSDLSRFGREDGWKASFQPRSITPSTGGPIQIESRADVFEGDDGAEKDLAAYRSRFAQVVTDPDLFAEMLQLPPLGDEATGLTFRQSGAATTDLRYYTIAWRDGNVTAAIIVNGFNGRLFPADALALARKQAQRIAAVGEGA